MSDESRPPEHERTAESREALKARRLEDGYEPDVRFLLANERTLLAWLRTAIALQAGGLAVLQFATKLEARSWIGVGLLLVGAACGMFGLSRYRAADRAIRADQLPEHGRGPEIVTIVVMVLGIVLAGAYLLSELRG